MPIATSEPAAGEILGTKKQTRYRLYGKAHRYVLSILWLSQGSKCFYSFTDCLNKPEVIAHKDHDPANWEPTNLVASCKHCNAVISNQAKAKDRSVRKHASVTEEDLPAESLVPLSHRMQADLEDWLMGKLGPGGPHRYLAAAFIEKEAGYDCHISPQTIHRYLVHPGHLTASNARWRLVQRHLPGDRPNHDTACVTWAGKNLDDDELELALYSVGRKEFLRQVSKKSTETVINRDGEPLTKP